MVSSENRLHLKKATKGPNYLRRMGRVKGNTKGLTMGKVVIPQT